MPPENYRYYRLDGRGHTQVGDWFVAESDEEAASQVKTKYPDAWCEVWQGNRLVARFSPTPDDPDLQAAVGERLSALARRLRLGLEG